jgi:DNA-binding NtrC family response regulator
MTDTLNLLIVEDSATDAKLLVLELQRTWRAIDFERVETGAAMRSALARKPWDIVLSDSSMPAFSARAALTILQENGLDIPFIVVSGTIGEENAVEAMRAGARDFVLKGQLARLTPAVERELHDRKIRDAKRVAEGNELRLEQQLRQLQKMEAVGNVLPLSPDNF